MSSKPKNISKRQAAMHTLHNAAFVFNSLSSVRKTTLFSRRYTSHVTQHYMYAPLGQSHIVNIINPSRVQNRRYTSHVAQHYMYGPSRAIAHCQHNKPLQGAKQAIHFSRCTTLHVCPSRAFAHCQHNKPL